MNWIFGRLHRDFLVFILPGFAVILLSKSAESENSVTSILLATIVLVLLDTGHAYASGWRAFRVAKDNPRLKQFIIFLPLIWFASFLWLIAGWPGFWSFVVYFTVFHHIRQFYGFSCWYQHLNRRACVWSGRFIYPLTILPIVVFHFRGDWQFYIYRPGDIFQWPSPLFFKVAVAAWLFTVVAWIIFESRLWRQGIREPNRILSLLVPAILQSTCFLFGRTSVEVLFPLLAVHGLSYLAITALGVRAIDSSGWKKSALLVSLVVVSSAGLAGLCEGFLGELETGMFGSSAVQAAISAILIAPNLWHYIVDGLIWKSDDPGARIIYGGAGH